MARTLELQAEPRTVTGKKVRFLRRAGMVPANIYGHGASIAIQTKERELDHLLTRGGHGAVVSVYLGDREPQTALIKTVQRDPKSARVVHVDFQAVSLSQVIAAPVPLRFIGESSAVRAYDGLLMHVLSEIQVTAATRDLPQYIDVDLTPLTELHATLRVSDLALPAGVAPINASDEVVVHVLPPTVAAEAPAPEAAPAEATGAQPGEAAGGEA